MTGSECVYMCHNSKVDFSDHIFSLHSQHLVLLIFFRLRKLASFRRNRRSGVEYIQREQTWTALGELSLKVSKE